MVEVLLPILFFLSLLSTKSRLAAASSFLYDACFLERGVGAVLVYGLDRAGREDEADGFLELRDVDRLSLEIDVFSHLPGRIELGSAGGVRVSAAYY